MYGRARHFDAHFEVVTPVVRAEDAHLARVLLERARALNPDAYLDVVIPSTRANDAHDIDELTRIGAFDRQARSLGIRGNVKYVLEQLGLPRTEYKRVQRRIKDAREVFSHAYLIADGKWYLPDGTEAQGW